MKLAFLISQPRAGSTLHQSIIGAHSEVATVSEPWFMLLATLPLRDSGWSADFDARLGLMGIESLLEVLPDGQNTLHEAIGMGCRHLYGAALNHLGGTVFLDKTPRYYAIIDSIRQVLPESKQLILIRNPLAVLISIIRTWTGVSHGALAPFRQDLMEAPRVLARFARDPQFNQMCIHYESTLEQPERSCREICEFLGIGYESTMLDYYQSRSEKWAMGDQGKIYSKRGIQQANSDSWTQYLKFPQIHRLCSEYLERLGPETFESLGYDWAEYKALLSRTTPSGWSRARTISFEHSIKLTGIASLGGVSKAMMNRIVKTFSAGK